METSLDADVLNSFNLRSHRRTYHTGVQSVCGTIFDAAIRAIGIHKRYLPITHHYTRCFLKMQPSRHVAGGCREQPVRNRLCRAATVGRTYGIHGAPAFLTAMVHAHLRGVRWAYKILQVHCHLKLFVKCNASKHPNSVQLEFET